MAAPWSTGSASQTYCVQEVLDRVKAAMHVPDDEVLAALVRVGADAPRESVHGGSRCALLFAVPRVLGAGLPAGS